MRLSFALGCLGVLVSSSALAAEWHPATDAKVHVGDAANVARQHLQAERTALSLESVSLRSAGVLGAGGYRTVRFEQRHQGLPVIGGQAAVRVGPNGQVRVVVLDVARRFPADIAPAIDAKAAVRAAQQHAGVTTTATGSTLTFFNDAGRGRLAWQLDLPTPDGGRRYLIDAERGKVLEARPLRLHALGRVYPISSVTTPTTIDTDLLELDPSTPQYLNGWNGNLRVTNYVSGDSMNGYVLEQTLQPSAGEDFLYDPPTTQTDPSDAFAQVGIYYHLTRMRDFFEANLGLDTSPASWRLVAVANVKEAGMPLDNAFFSPQGIGAPWNAPNLIAIGQGQSFDFAQDSDVFNHEFTHYVTENAIAYNAGGFHFDSYGRSPFSAAIDEGLSDYFACTVNDDPLLGEASLALLGVARDLQDSSKVCPDDMHGESHDDGEIIGSVAWSLREALGASSADDLVWRAASLLTFGASFGDFGRGLLQGADEMVTEGKLTAMQRSDVEATLTSRGLHECDPELPLHAGEPRSESLRGFNPGSCQQVRMNGFSRQSMFHYAVTPGADAEGIALDVQLDAPADADLLWAVHVRKNEHVAFEVGFPPTISDEDMVVENITAAELSLVIDAQSMPAFEPGASYHFVITHQNCAPTTMTLSAQDIEPMPMGEGGAGGSGGSAPQADPPSDQLVEGGCGCRLDAGEEPAAGGWLLLAALALTGLRRRRRPIAPRD